MPQLLDARGLACPLPAIKARAALAALPPGETLIVLATDPEAPVDIGALAARSEALCRKRPLYPGFRGYPTYIA